MDDTLSADCIVLGWRGGAEDLGARNAGNLGCRDANATARGVDGDTVSISQAAHQHQRGVGGAVVHGKCRTLLEAEPLGQRQDLCLRNCDQLGLAAETGTGDNPVANRVGAHPFPFAVGVGDRWMRIGLGTALLSALALRACEVGIIRFTGTIHSDNIAIKRLLEKVVGVYESKSAGMGAVEVAVDLQ